MGAKLDLTGEKYGRLTVLKESNSRRNNKIYWQCKCECGNEKVIWTDSLRQGKVKSCGCLGRENHYTSNRQHGHSINGKCTSEYNSWMNMKERCYNPNYLGFNYWGGRGIKVCERWLSFDNFILDMGLKPTQKHTLDRYPNKHGDYELSNCRWATMKEQQNNRTNNRWIKFNELNKTLTEWAAIFKVTPSVLHGHFKSGKSMQDIVLFYRKKKAIQI